MAAQRTLVPICGFGCFWPLAWRCPAAPARACRASRASARAPSKLRPPPSGSEAAVQSRYTPEELVGRWGFTSYHRDQDRARTEAAARGQCKNPYVIARGPQGGIMMHLADQRQPTELRLKGSASGKQYIGPAGEAGVAEDREIVVVRRPYPGHALRRSGCGQPLRQHDLRALRHRRA